MNFIELENKYQSYKQELIETIETLGEMCSNFPQDHPEYFKGYESVNNPFELNSYETYESHHLDPNKNEVVVNFSYSDPYDEIMDSDSRVYYPLKWLEAVFDGKKESIDSIQDEIAKCIIKHHSSEESQEKRDIICKARDYGIITDQKAKELLKDAYQFLD